MKKLLVLCALISFTNSLSAKSAFAKANHALSEVFISRIINESSGVFRIYLSDKEIDALTIMPHSTADLHKSVALSSKGTVWIYPIQGSFETIFLQMGNAASGTCDSHDEMPIAMSFWYDNPSLPTNLRTYRRLCMERATGLQLTINRDGSIMLHTIDVK